MAILKDLIVNGSSRFIGKVYSNGGFEGNLTGSSTKIKDSGNSSDITIAYSKAGLDSTSWLAGWNSYELRAISPAKITAGAATKATQDGSGNTITTTYATKTELNNALGNVEALLAAI